MAIQLIARGGKRGNQWTLTAEGKAFLEGLTTELTVVTVAGVYRSGKSTLLSALADDGEVFKIGSSTNACTMGVYAAPRLIDWDDGKKILLIDTEGLDSVERHADAQHDTKIFVLALLLGSTMVYNSPGPITDANLNTMSLVSQLTQKMATGCAQGVATAMPHLVWCARDFALKLESADGKPITPTEYLEQCIRPTGNRTKDKVRTALRSYFPRRSCTTIVRPVLEEQDLQGNLLQSPNLRPEFRTQLSAFRQSLFDEADVKRVNGLAMTGPLLVTMIESWLVGLNTKNAVPHLDDAWTSLCRSQNLMAMRASAMRFDDALTSVSLPLAPTPLSHRLWALRADALAFYKAERFVHEADPFLEEHTAKLNASIQTTLDRNAAMVQSRLDALLAQAEAPLLVAVQTASLSDLREAFASARSSFQNGLVAAFGQDHSREPTLYMGAFDTAANRLLLQSIDTLETKACAQKDALNAALRRAGEEHDAATLQCQTLERSVGTLTDRLADSETANAALHAKETAAAARLAEAETAHSEARERWRLEAEARRRGATQELEEWKASMMQRIQESNDAKSTLQSRIDALESDASNAASELLRLSEAHSNANARLQQMDRYVQQAVEAERKAQALTKDLAKAKTIHAELEQAGKHLKQRQANEVALLQSQVANSVAKSKQMLTSKEAALERLRQEHAVVQNTLAEAESALETATASLDSTLASMATAEAKRTMLASTLESARASHAKECLEHTAVVDALQKTKAEAENRVDTLQADRSAASEATAKATADLEMQLANARSQCDDAKSKLKAQSGEMADRFASLSETLSGKKRKLAELETTLDSQRSKVFEYDHLLKRTAELDKTNAELETETRKLRRELDDIKSDHELQITRLRLQLQMQ